MKTTYSPIGVINISFPLSDQPVLGKWTVYAEIQRNSFNVSFEIQKYGRLRFAMIWSVVVYIFQMFLLVSLI